MPLFYSPGVFRGPGGIVQLEVSTDFVYIGPYETPTLTTAQLGVFHASDASFVVRNTGGNVEGALRATTVVTFGSETAHDLYIRAGGANRWHVLSASGHLEPDADLTYDVGNTTHEVRNLYIGGTGGAGILFTNAGTSLTENSGFLVSSGGVIANNGALGFRDGGGGFTFTVSAGVVDVNANSSGNRMKITGQIAAGTAGTTADVLLASGATRTAGWIVRVDNNTTRKWGMKFDGRVFESVPNSAPTDGDLQASEVTWYTDEAVNTLLARVKYADGTTLKLGTVALV
jgi:hypothetical protein